ncbi:MAG: hypothetical protein UU46_C0028G0005 [Candidatus Uhrbacteria bacterium GW2011_GWD1_41_16]|uniref:DUF362 domain-containing protein n=1 Tax=Candidatus Uhrbacteria bacterium GW2011_GWC1_41_20 TaxID=1618983 RepID=A0A0G0YF41_9BACT|nr:MAG: hypothetical protein UT52_C0018G0034 [Candidatus Uhrbacteria bacterium GW2011_GWE1_39_46]KKR63309.1 MAG: hypothetical protein UU04_C0021G0032 [Candidatus Uhrbacteria bacterium GW2011_GWC2_40_450]KKR89092.1 MAG: hypothetical protein UU36_C0036G0004 [Candidatus Uhrbacteria bacterium GW2011_GWE2_41_1153]KKR94933.1 MAG: hypothetical protein UU46_C0028G0005 [Candidatus Uhrbacteria bacterium GW2011_GWD1_41_16]KKR98957.1 MAG: hypothetical protein UU50_C0012G0005 [Candidatus Uhrbacteria bacteri
MKNVILQTGENRRQTVRKAVEELGDEFITKCKEAKSIFIKVNLVDYQYELACTHVDAVRGLLDVIQTYCKTPVKVGDAAYRGTKAGFEHLGYERLLNEYFDIELVDLFDDNSVDGSTIRRDGSQNPIYRSKIAVESDLTICLAPLKVHDQVGLDACVYSWTTGTWIVPSRISATGRVWARWPWLEEEGEEAHSQSIASLYKEKPCDLGIVDGIIVMEGEGPVQGSAIPMGFVLAGFDTVAVDAVAGTLIGLDISTIGYLQKIAEEKNGTADLSHINVPPMLIAEITRSIKRPVGY